MERIVTGTIAGLALLLAGCLPCVHPLYTESDLILDDRLVGVWQPADSDDKWIFDGADEAKVYGLTHVDGKGAGRLEVRVLRLGEHSFVDIFPSDSEMIRNGLYAAHMLPVHTFWQAAIGDDEVSLAIMNPTWLKEGLKAGTLDVKHEIVTVDDDEAVVLTAGTAELQRFVLKHVETPDAWGGPIVLRRLGTPSED